MSIVIDSTLTIPIDAHQLESFSTWAKLNYGNYTEYVECLKTSGDVNDFIWAEIFTTDMRTAWIESNDYLRNRSNDANAKRCQLNRKRINAKVRYMIFKLGKLAFKEEILQRRQLARIQAQQRLEANSTTDEQREREEETRRQEAEFQREQRNFIHANTIMMYSYICNILWGMDSTDMETDRLTLERFFRHNERRVIIEMLRLPFLDDVYDREEQLRTVIYMLIDEQNQTLNPTMNIIPMTPPTTPPSKKIQYTQKEIPKDKALLHMEDDCCICMEKHRIHSTVQPPCGHQIGKSCFQEWAKKCVNKVSCPLCRVHCHDVFEMVGEPNEGTKGTKVPQPPSL